MNTLFDTRLPRNSYYPRNPSHTTNTSLDQSAVHGPCGWLRFPRSGGYWGVTLDVSVLELVSCEGGEWKIQSKNQVKEWKIQS